MEHKKSEKLYYSIGELAEMFDVNTSLIRFWEKEFDIIKPHKSKKGTRFYTKKDVDQFHLIYHLVKERKFTISGAKSHIDSNPNKVETDFETLKTLESVKKFLLQLRKNL